MNLFLSELNIIGIVHPGTYVDVTNHEEYDEQVRSWLKLEFIHCKSAHLQIEQMTQCTLRTQFFYFCTGYVWTTYVFILYLSFKEEGVQVVQLTQVLLKKITKAGSPEWKKSTFPTTMKTSKIPTNLFPIISRNIRIGGNLKLQKLGLSSFLGDASSLALTSCIVASLTSRANHQEVSQCWMEFKSRCFGFGFLKMDFP